MENLSQRDANQMDGNQDKPKNHGTLFLANLFVWIVHILESWIWLDQMQMLDSWTHSRLEDYDSIS